jgi:hypothetical protein
MENKEVKIMKIGCALGHTYFMYDFIRLATYGGQFKNNVYMMLAFGSALLVILSCVSLMIDLHDEYKEYKEYKEDEEDEEDA